MNREIKFRGKVYHYGNDCGWVYGDFYRYYNGSLHYTIVSLDEFETKEYAVEISTVGQYTGLLDKNKTEIYEGDIIKGLNGKIDIVVFKLGCFYWDGFPLIFDGESDSFEIYPTEDWSEVIGNIYENPELIPTKD